MRLVYGSPPNPARGARELVEGLKFPEELARKLREANERAELGKALFNLIAPACGEEPLP